MGIDNKPCPCGSAEPYQNCCAALIEGRRRAASAEQLMRSRFCAYRNADAAYLLQSWHASTRPTDTLDQFKRSCDGTDWLGLRILSSPSPDAVEFVAFYAEAGGGVGQLHERSNFCNENGHWYYLDGQMLTPIKISRNDPCYCGSGLKLKKCHPV